MKNHILLENYFLPSDLMVIIPENHWVENWTSPAIDALGEPDEEITIYGKPDPCNFEAMMRIRK
ncbi:hypothetical protein IWQ51_004088 [Labrenzia sp. EL_142]|nr:hypothetical protein [Labrenzia sp. EL_142]